MTGPHGTHEVAPDGTRWPTRGTALISAAAVVMVLAACGGGDGATSTSPDDPVEGDAYFQQSEGPPYPLVFHLRQRDKERATT